MLTKFCGFESPPHHNGETKPHQKSHVLYIVHYCCTNGKVGLVDW
jgi:hypothetical protein